VVFGGYFSPYSIDFSPIYWEYPLGGTLQAATPSSHLNTTPVPDPRCLGEELQCHHEVTRYAKLFVRLTSYLCTYLLLTLVLRPLVDVIYEG
jgi:hypothetical protein